MSKWTHICGCIRYDVLPLRPGIKEEVQGWLKETVFGPAAGFRGDHHTELPQGSEGSIDYQIWRNEEDASLSTFAVSFFGDLRDYHLEELDNLREWFKRITVDLANNAMKGGSYPITVRQAVLQAEFEGAQTVFLYSAWDEEGTNFEVREQHK